MKTLLHLHPHSGCSTAERENCVSFWSIELLVFGYFSSRSLCYMRIRKRRRIHDILLTVGKRTSLPSYSTSMCLPYFHVSTLPPHVYPTSTCLLYLHMLTSSLYVYHSFTYLIQFRTHVEFENENTFALEPSQHLLYGWAWELCFLVSLTHTYIQPNVKTQGHQNCTKNINIAWYVLQLRDVY